MTLKKTIGILGGMGPEASAYFYNLLIQLAHKKYGAVQDIDFPPVLIYNLPLAGFDETGITDEALVERQLIAGVQKLEKGGSDFIIIACNTVHTFYDAMQASIKIPILSIVDETVRTAQDNGYARVGILSSESTNKLNLYKDKLEGSGIATISANPEQQQALNEIILHVMAGEHKNKDAAVAAAIIDDMAAAGADAVILGCTELPLAIEALKAALPVLNANEIIIDRALATALA